jgi:hypothetical protein
MRKYITLFFSVSLFLLSCKGNKPEDGIINHDRMISLLTDIHIADGRMYRVRQDPDSLYKYGMGTYLAVFKKYDTDSVQFKKSFKYYSTQPAEMEAIYNQILKNLQRKTDSLNKIQLKQLNALPKK